MARLMTTATLKPVYSRSESTLHKRDEGYTEASPAHRRNGLQAPCTWRECQHMCIYTSRTNRPKETRVQLILSIRVVSVVRISYAILVSICLSTLRPETVPAS
jgi:hypothetical protein